MSNPALAGFSARYQVFGLVIQSELPLPQLLPSHADAMISIRLGDVPQKLEPILSEGAFYQSNALQVLINVDNIARYFIQNGKEITIEIAQGADEQSVQTILFGTVLAVVLHQRGVLPLHGSALERGEEAILLLGASRAGKSTTSAALLSRGFRLLSDDMAVIAFEDKRPIVFSGIPQQNLWQDALDYLEKSSDSLEELSLKLNKYVLPVGDKFYDKALPIRRIYILELGDSAPSLEAFRGLEGFHRLAAQVFREQFVNPVNGAALLTKQLMALAHAVPIRRIIRPEGIASHEEIVRLIEADSAIED